MKKCSFILITLLLLFCISSCTKNRFAIDVKDNFENVKFARFDKDLLQIDSFNIENQKAELQEVYGDFFDDYASRVMLLGNVQDVDFNDYLLGLLADSMFLEINKEVDVVFENMTAIEEEVAVAFAYARHYFPEVEIPRLATHVSGFNQSFILSKNNILSVSLDNYLGSDYAPYSQIAYEYMLSGMTKDNVAPDLVFAFLSTSFDVTPKDIDKRGHAWTLLEKMLSTGKLLYLQSIFMPNRTEAEILGFTAEEWKWCEENEKQMWQYLMENKHLYNTSSLLQSKYVNPGPCTSYFGPESTAQAVLWIGFQIIKSYMESDTNLSLQDLMNESDYQYILSKSNYKP